MMIEDNFTPDRYDQTSSDLLGPEESSEMHATHKTVEGIGSETRKKIETYYKLNKTTDESSPQESASDVQVRNATQTPESAFKVVKVDNDSEHQRSDKKQ